MMKYLKKLNIFCSVVIFFGISLFVLNQGVKAEGIQIPENVSLYQAVKDFPIKDGDKILATIKKNSYLYLEQYPNKELYLQFGVDKLVVEPNSFIKVEEGQNSTIPAYYSFNPEMNSFLSYKTSMTGWDKAGLAVMEFNENGSYPIFQETDKGYETLIGNRLIFIKKESTEEASPAAGITDNPKVEVTPSAQISTVDQNNQSGANTTLAESQKLETSINKLSTSVQSTSTSTSFNGTEKYLKVPNNDVHFYLYKNGEYKVAGELTAGQEYVINSHLSGWLKVKFGNTYAYVKTNEVIPSNGSSVKNLNQGAANIDRFFKTFKSLPIYDNTSGRLVEFGKIDAGIEYPIIRQTSTNWLEIDFAGRIGYVYVPYLQLQVNKTDKFFTPFQKNAPVFINQGGASIYVGTLNLNQQYPILGFIPGFTQIKYGNRYGYVRTGSIIPSSGTSIKNMNNNLLNSGKVFKTYRTLSIYDNTSGSLVEFGRMNEGQSYPFIKQTSNDWIMVDLAGRTGYVYKPHLILPVGQSDKYFKTVYGNTPIVINVNGEDRKVADFQQGQEYPIIGQIPNFVRVQYGDSFAYIRASYLSASSGSSIKNLTVGTPKAQRYLSANINTPVYDNTSGSLVKFGQLEPGTKYPVIEATSRYWVKVNFGGRIGYIYKPRVSLDFISSDQFFQPLERDVPVYINQNGTNVKVASLINEQKYKIQSQIEGYIRIAYGNSFGYVRTGEVFPTDGTGITNLNTGLVNSYQKLKNAQVVEVYDNTLDSKKVIATFEPGQEYPVIKQTSSDWLQISVAGRIGYVKKSLVSTGIIKIYQTSNYNISFDDMFQKQWALGPQTDKSYKTYVSSTFITLDDSNPLIGCVNMGPLNVRGGPGTSYWVVGQLASGVKVSIIDKLGDWYQIKYTNTWKNASPDDIRSYLNPKNITPDSIYYYQFLKLSESAGLEADEVNAKILNGNGILANKAKTFIDAASKYHVNEIYLISHAFLETGKGSSRLANGILVSTVDGKPVTPKVVYNMFGIGAYDNCAEQCGSETAYKEGWFTPEAAIIGGAEFIGGSYINDSRYLQDTLYEMRWNPAYPATHQYATDVGWAYKQVSQISQLYSLLDNYQVTFDVPVFQ